MHIVGFLMGRLICCVTYLNESSISGELGSFFFLLRACLCLSSFRCLPYSMMFSQVVRHRLQVCVQPLKQPAVQLMYDINEHEFLQLQTKTKILMHCSLDLMLYHLHTEFKKPMVIALVSSTEVP